MPQTRQQEISTTQPPLCCTACHKQDSRKSPPSNHHYAALHATNKTAGNLHHPTTPMLHCMPQTRQQEISTTQPPLCCTACHKQDSRKSPPLNHPYAALQATNKTTGNLHHPTAPMLHSMPQTRQQEISTTQPPLCCTACHKQDSRKSPPPNHPYAALHATNKTAGNLHHPTTPMLHCMPQTRQQEISTTQPPLCCTACHKQDSRKSPPSNHPYAALHATNKTAGNLHHSTTPMLHCMPQTRQQEISTIQPPLCCTACHKQDSRKSPPPNRPYAALHATNKTAGNLHHPTAPMLHCMPQTRQQEISTTQPPLCCTACHKQDSRKSPPPNRPYAALHATNKTAGNLHHPTTPMLHCMPQTRQQEISTIQPPLCCTACHKQDSRKSPPLNHPYAALHATNKTAGNLHHPTAPMLHCMPQTRQQEISTIQPPLCCTAYHKQDSRKSPPLNHPYAALHATNKTAGNLHHPTTPMLHCMPQTRQQEISTSQTAPMLDCMPQTRQQEISTTQPPLCCTACHKQDSRKSPPLNHPYAALHATNKTAGNLHHPTTPMLHCMPQTRQQEITTTQPPLCCTACHKQDSRKSPPSNHSYAALHATNKTAGNLHHPTTPMLHCMPQTRQQEISTTQPPLCCTACHKQDSRKSPPSNRPYAALHATNKTAGNLHHPTTPMLHCMPQTRQQEISTTQPPLCCTACHKQDSRKSPPHKPPLCWTACHKQDSRKSPPPNRPYAALHATNKTAGNLHHSTTPMLHCMPQTRQQEISTTRPPLCCTACHKQESRKSPPPNHPYAALHATNKTAGNLHHPTTPMLHCMPQTRQQEISTTQPPLCCTACHKQDSRKSPPPNHPYAALHATNKTAGNLHHPTAPMLHCMPQTRQQEISTTQPPLCCTACHKQDSRKSPPSNHPYAALHATNKTAGHLYHPTTPMLHCIPQTRQQEISTIQPPLCCTACHKQDSRTSLPSNHSYAALHTTNKTAGNLHHPTAPMLHCMPQTRQQEISTIQPPLCCTACHKQDSRKSPPPNHSYAALHTTNKTAGNLHHPTTPMLHCMPQTRQQEISTIQPPLCCTACHKQDSRKSPPPNHPYAALHTTNKTAGHLHHPATPMLHCMPQTRQQEISTIQPPLCCTACHKQDSRKSPPSNHPYAALHVFW